MLYTSHRLKICSLKWWIFQLFYVTLNFGLTTKKKVDTQQLHFKSIYNGSNFMNLRTNLDRSYWLLEGYYIVAIPQHYFLKFVILYNKFLFLFTIICSFNVILTLLHYCSHCSIVTIIVALYSEFVDRWSKVCSSVSVLKTSQ